MYERIIGESLRLAVDQAFALDEAEVAAIQADLDGLTSEQRSEVLQQVVAGESAGLRSEVAAAYMSGDQETITYVSDMAYEHAVMGVCRTALYGGKMRRERKDALIEQRKSTIRRMNGRNTQ